MSQRPFFIDDYIVFFVDVAVAKFDVVSPADVVVFVFRLVVVALVLFCSCCCCHDSGVAWYFLEIFADNFDDLDDVVEFAVCRLHLRFLVDLVVFLFSHSL